IKAIKEFASMIPTGEIAPPSGGVFKNILIIGIGGSALGPQLINDALRIGGSGDFEKILRDKLTRKGIVAK
ncbi:hypothetical protein OAE01_01705, partial [Akkermansiaceae bacterium]|nr:hypothetical protein [Akkermansiaceae bacterium]